MTKRVHQPSLQSTIQHGTPSAGAVALSKWLTEQNAGPKMTLRNVTPFDPNRSK